MTTELPDLSPLPAALRALLEAELAAGNQVAEVDYGFPAPPVGFCILLAQAVSTRAADAADGLRYREWPNWKNYNGYTDASELFFVLNPPLAPMSDASPTTISVPASALAPQPAIDLLQHFTQSMNIDYEKWHDGIGYDLDALRAMSPAEQSAAESLLLARSPFDWRDIEALALLDTPPARAALQTALQSEDAEMRLAVARYAPDLVSAEQQTASLVAALETASLYRGLSQTLDAIAAFHPTALPPAVEDALWRCLQEREGEVAVHLAALLTYIHGQAQAPFDFALRPLFLLFHTEDATQRAAAVAALRKRFNLPAENLS